MMARAWGTLVAHAAYAWVRLALWWMGEAA